MITFEGYYEISKATSNYLWLYPEEMQKRVWKQVTEFRDQGFSFYFSLYLTYTRFYHGS